MTLDGPGMLSEPQLSLAENAGVPTWCFPKCLLFEHVDWEFLRGIKGAVCLYSFMVIWSLPEPIVCESGCIEPRLWEGLAEESGIISALLSLLFFSFSPAWLSLSLSPSLFLLSACSRLLLSPSRLLIRNHQIVSVTMSSAAARALVIVPAAQNKWLGENGVFQLRCKAS